MNRHWTRWINATLDTFFKDLIQAKGGVYLFIEGLQRQMPDSTTDFVEFRWSGPHCREISKDVWYLDVELNFIVNSVTNRTDTHTHKRIVGLVQSSMPNSISVLKYGSTVGVDDETLLGCLQLRAEQQGILSSYLGSIQDMVELEQTSIEAGYRMLL